MKPKHQGLWVLCVIAAVLLLAWSLIEVGLTAGRAITRLLAVGWDVFLGRQGASGFLFMLGCLPNEACEAAFSEVWRQEYPLYIPVLALVTLWVAAMLSVFARASLKKKSPGGARWAKPRDLKLYLKGEKDSSRRGYLGLLPDGRMLRPPERLRCAHTLLLGATGARKSTAYHKPNMMIDAYDRVSAIVVDLKYPDTVSGFFDLVPHFVKAGHDVQLFLPYGEHTLRLPLLADTGAFQGASEAADMIAPDVRHEAASFYRKQERLLLIALLMGMAREERGEQASLGLLFRLLRQGRAAVQSYIHKHPDTVVRETAKGFFDLDAGKQGGIIAGLAGELQAFDDPRLERATTASKNPKENLDLEGIGLRPALLYIGIPQEHLQGTRATVLLKLLKRSIDLALLKTANTHGGRLPTHLSFYLDEFANLGVLPNVSEMFATMRSRRVAYHVSLQNRAQGEALYGRDTFRSFFTNNFQQVIIFPRSLRFEDADYFSRALGFMTVLDRAEGVSSEGFLGRRRRSKVLREVARPQLSVEEMMDWPEEMGVLIAAGVPPVKVLLPRLDEARVLGVRNLLHRKYQDLLEVPAPHLLAQILVQRRVGGVIPAAASRQEHPPIFEVELQTPGGTFEDVEVKGRAPSKRMKQLEKPNSGPHQALLGWLDALSRYPISMKEHRNPRSNALSKMSIDLSTVPAPLRNPDDLNTWTEQGWVKVSNQEIGLVGKGLGVIGKKRLQQLQRTAEQMSPRAEGQAEKARSASPVPSPTKGDTSRQADIEKLKQYVERNGRLLKGHPQRKNSSETRDAPEAIGAYREGVVVLNKGLIESIIEVPLPEDLETKGAKDEVGSTLEIPLRYLERLEPLRVWFDENRHRLKGHDAYETLVAKGETALAVGLFRPDVVALPKRILKKILGHVPAYGKTTRPTIDSKRRYLVRIELSSQKE